jgi:hypothetical protein
VRPNYLSPAFSKRSDEGLEFLAAVDDRVGFSLFWLDIVRPLLEEAQAKTLLEIGADAGTHTRWLLRYCEAVDGRLIVVEPDVRPPLLRMVEGSVHVQLMAEISETALRKIAMPVDAVLLEGDLNYHTVLRDLQGIQELSRRMVRRLPLVVFANAGWPYARRDMYYDSQRMLAEGRHGYARLGMTPWSEGLEKGMINSPFENASVEGGPHNGVLTAAEDFVALAEENLRLYVLPVNHGLGIICLAESPEEHFIRTNVLPPPSLARFLETWELARLNTIVSRLRAWRDRDCRSGPKAWVARQVLRIGRRLLARMES